MPFWRFSASSLWLILLSPNPRLLHILEVFSLSITGEVQDGRNVPLALAGGRGYFWDVFRCSGEPLEKTRGWDSRAQGQGWCGLPGGDAPPSSHASPTGMPTITPIPTRNACPGPINMPESMAALGRGHQQHPAGRSWVGKALLHMLLAEKSQEILLFQKMCCFCSGMWGRSPHHSAPPWWWSREGLRQQVSVRPPGVRWGTPPTLPSPQSDPRHLIRFNFPQILHIMFLLH